MKIKFDLSEDVFRSWCTILVGWDLDAVKKLHEANSEEKIEWDDLIGSNGFCILASLKNGKKGHLVWLEDFDMTTSRVSTLSHELNHLTFDILHTKGVPLRHENQEVFAYLQQFYFINALIVLQKQINKQAKQILKKHGGTKKSIRRSKAKKGRTNPSR